MELGHKYKDGLKRFRAQPNQTTRRAGMGPIDTINETDAFSGSKPFTSKTPARVRLQLLVSLHGLPRVHVRNWPSRGSVAEHPITLPWLEFSLFPFLNPLVILPPPSSNCLVRQIYPVSLCEDWLGSGR